MKGRASATASCMSLHALDGRTRRGGPGLTRLSGRPQVSEHATWSSRYYGRIISAALAAVGARRAAAGPCTGTAPQAPSASAYGQRPAAHRPPAAITCMLVAARSAHMSLVKGLGLGRALGERARVGQACSQRQPRDAFLRLRAAHGLVRQARQPTWCRSSRGTRRPGRRWCPAASTSSSLWAAQRRAPGDSCLRTSVALG